MPSPLPFGLTDAALAAAMAEPDPDSLAAATRLRQTFGPELAAAALSQAALRRAARRKFGSAAEQMFFTRAGLEQATRPEVADHHADRFLAAGAAGSGRLGCGIGSDALAFLRAGLAVIAVERDPETAAVAAANLAGRARVIVADAEQVADDLLTAGSRGVLRPGPADRHGRLWRVEDFSPSWSLVSRLLDGPRTAGVKLGPALPHRFIPGHRRGRVVHPSRRHRRGRPVGRPRCGARRTRGAWSVPTSAVRSHRFAVTEVPQLPVRDLGQLPVRAGRCGDPGRRGRSAGRRAAGRPARPAAGLPDR